MSTQSLADKQRVMEAQLQAVVDIIAVRNFRAATVEYEMEMNGYTPEIGVQIEALEHEDEVIEVLLDAIQTKLDETAVELGIADEHGHMRSIEQYVATVLGRRQ